MGEGFGTTSARLSGAGEALWTEPLDGLHGGWEAAWTVTVEGEQALISISDGPESKTVQIGSDGVVLHDGLGRFFGQGHQMFWPNQSELAFISPAGDTYGASTPGNVLPSLVQHDGRIYGQSMYRNDPSGVCGLLCSIIYRQRLGSTTSPGSTTITNVASTFEVP